MNPFLITYHFFESGKRTILIATGAVIKIKVSMAAAFKAGTTLKVALNGVSNAPIGNSATGSGSFYSCAQSIGLKVTLTLKWH
jgi:hypothetical protein